jgi:hypothetical protein
MLYKDLKLPAGIRQAIKTLVDAGMVVVTEALLEDCKKSDGTRFRTFTLSGRHDLALIVKNIKDLSGVTVNTPLEKKYHPPVIEEEVEPEGVNFWLERSKWIRLSGDELYPLVTEECLGDLADAPADIQVDVKQKFDRLCEPEDWPLP